MENIMCEKKERESSAETRKGCLYQPVTAQQKTKMIYGLNCKHTWNNQRLKGDDTEMPAASMQKQKKGYFAAVPQTEYSM